MDQYRLPLTVREARTAQVAHGIAELEIVGTQPGLTNTCHSLSVIGICWISDLVLITVIANDLVSTQHGLEHVCS